MIPIAALSQVTPPGQWRQIIPTLGTYHLYGRQNADLLYTENETNNSRLWGVPNAGPYVKDAFHRYLWTATNRR